jgi:hypothetical protein
MPTHIKVAIGKPPKHRGHEHHDNDKQPAGWVKSREPLIEPRAANKNLALGRWISRASENSGPKIAPGIKSS